MSARQEDIARQLGLSITTISLALRDSPKIAEETRVLVRQTAAKMGYIHRPRSNFSFDVIKLEMKTIAFVMQYAASNAFYGGVLNGAESECRRHDLALNYILLPELNARVLKQCRESDALLLVGLIEEEHIEQLCTYERPCILVDSYRPELDIDQLCLKNKSSLIQTVRRLHQLGHTRIAFLRGESHIPSLEDRFRGYYDTMLQLGLQPLQIFCPGTQLLTTSEEVMAEWLQSNHNLPFTALIGCSDEAAIGALQALKKHGLRIPDDVSLVGFDGIEMSQTTWPPLTTHQVDRELMGVLAVRQLIERAKNPQAPAQTTVLGTTFVERSSVRSLL